MNKNKFEKIVTEKSNMLIVGKTNSGKTTLIDSVLDATADSERRIIAIEDVKEIHLR